MATNEPTLPTNRAFIIQFSATADGVQRFEGRVEHLTSGHATHFHSLGELQTFFVHFLPPLQASAQGEMQEKTENKRHGIE